MKLGLLFGNQSRCLRECTKTYCLRWRKGGDCRRAPSRNHRLPDRTWRGLDSGGCTLCSEVEEGGELPALVVAPQHVDRVLKPDFEGEDECQHLDGEAATVDVVSQEEVLGGF